MNQIAEHSSSVKEATLTRRSIRKFKTDAIPQQQLEEILSLTQRAPSAWNLQPWRYVVVTNPELKAKLQEAAFNQGQITSAPAVIVMYSDMKNTLETVKEVIHPGVPADQLENRVNGVLQAFAKNSEIQTETWGAGQSYIALGYLMLVAQSFGYSSSPMLGFNPTKVKEILGLPENVMVPALLPIGIAAEEGSSHHRHAVERITTWR